MYMAGNSKAIFIMYYIIIAELDLDIPLADTNLRDIEDTLTQREICISVNNTLYVSFVGYIQHLEDKKQNDTSA